MKMKNLKQSLEFAKLIKFLNKENFFLNKYLFHFNKSVKISRKFSVTNVFPRLFLEFFLVLCVVIASFYLISKNFQLNLLFESITVYITVAYRLVPSVSRLSTNFQSISVGRASLNTLIDIYYSKDISNNLNNFGYNNEEKISKVTSFNNSIEIKDLSFKHENSNEFTLKNLNFKIKKGEFIGIVGDSGSGKTTFVDVFLRILKPHSGKILVDENELQDDSHLSVGYVSQNSYILDDTIVNNIAFGIEKKKIDYDLVYQSIKSAKIDKFVNNLSDGVNTILRERGAILSGGQAQRINIARALYLKPKILILDEATSGLDLKTEKEFLNDLNQIKEIKTIILISHRKESMFFCDKLFEIKNGQIFESEK